jgi:hypothetical protein
MTRLNAVAIPEPIMPVGHHHEFGLDTFGLTR